MNYFVKSKYIFDVNNKKNFAGILEIKDGLIANIFDYNEKISEEIMDFGEKMIIPAFIDSHIHFYLASLVNSKKIVFINGNSAEEVAQKTKIIPIYKGWKIGIGWYVSDFFNQAYPNKEILDKYTGDIPTMLISGDAHTIWLNTKALEVLQIKNDTLLKDTNGEVLKEFGEITGVFLEAIAIFYLAKVLEIYKEDFFKYGKKYMNTLNKMGITAVGDVALTGEGPDDLVYPELYEKIKNPSIKISFFPTMREDIKDLKKVYAKYRFDMLQMGGVKQFFDGVTSSHTAFLKKEYENPYYKGDVGGTLLPIEKMKKLINLANKNSLPIRIHSIGDKANQLVLKFLKEATNKYPLYKHIYNTVEHLEVMDFEDLYLVNQKNLVLSVQPSHLLVGYETLNEEVGVERASKMFPFESFRKSGGVLSFGTDAPVVFGVSPLESIYYAVNRKTKDNLPKNSLMPNEKMNVVDCLVAHTLGGAKALSRNDIGSLEIGKKADFVVLNKDLLTVSDILEVNIEKTYINGRKVFSND